MQISTAISDGVLAAIALWCARLTWLAGSRAGTGGLALVGLAALAGVLRFSVAPGILPVHSFLSGLAGQVGIPLLAFGFVAVAFPTGGLSTHDLPFAAAILVLFLAFRFAIGLSLYGTAVGGLAALAIVAAGVRLLPSTSGTAAIVGAIVLVVAGLYIGTKGQLYGVPRVDVFHYLTALSMALLAAGLVRASS